MARPFLRPFGRFAVILGVLGTAWLAGCGDYQKVLKSTDPELKWTRAQEYFADDRCIQALPLLQELIGLFGAPSAWRTCTTCMPRPTSASRMVMARYTMRNFSKTFPTSDRAEEAEYQAALCSYRLSPGPTLDQSDTRNAMDELQLFLDRHPESDKRDTCNSMIAALRTKLETKAWIGAKLYYTTGKFQSASQALANFMEDWPVSQYGEEAQFSSSNRNSFTPNRVRNGVKPSGMRMPLNPTLPLRPVSLKVRGSARRNNSTARAVKGSTAHRRTDEHTTRRAQRP